MTFWDVPSVIVRPEAGPLHRILLISVTVVSRRAARLRLLTNPRQISHFEPVENFG